MRVTPETRRVY